MRELRIDFSGRMPLTRKLLWSAIIMVLLLSAATVTTLVRTRAELNRLLAESTKREQQNKQLVAQTQKASRVDASDAEKMLNAPWDDLFRGVEMADSVDVALLALKPSPQKREVILVGEARNLASIYDYLDRLGQDGLIEAPYIANYQLRLDEPGRPVRFEIHAKW